MLCHHCRAKQPDENRFCGQCGTPLGTAKVVAPPDLPTSYEGEWRYVTVLFCDLVNATKLVRSLTPELYKQRVLSVYKDMSQRTISEHGGKIIEFQGDGVVAQFTGKETSTEAAVRAARDMVDLVQQWRGVDHGTENAQPATRIQLRIGIASGVVMLNPLANPDSPEPQIIGDPPNLASRLQAYAAPNEVLVSDEIQHLLGKRYEFEPLENLNLKGFPASTRAWKLGKCHEDQPRFELTNRVNLTPLVGREEPLETLKNRWQDAKSGMGQVVFISGEPGIGKSRVVSEFQRSMTRFSEPKIILRYQCSPFAGESPLFPVAQQFTQAAGIQLDDDKATIEAKLRTLLKSWDVDIKHYLRLLLPVMMNQSEAMPEKEMGERGIEKAIRACTVLPFLFTIRCPVLVIIEDMQWADPASHELLRRSIMKAQGFGMLILVTSRPEYTPPPSRDDYVSEIRLKRMNAKASQRLLNRVVMSQHIPANWAEHIVEKSGGVPLYIEEMALHISHLLASQKNGDEPASLSLPPSIFDLFMERFMRLSPQQQRLAKMAAIIGDRFDLLSLQRLSQLGDTEITTLLSDICAQDICNPVGDTDTQFHFAHALQHDTIYESMLGIQKYTLHRKMVDILLNMAHPPSAMTRQQIAHHKKMMKKFSAFSDEEEEDGENKEPVNTDDESDPDA